MSETSKKVAAALAAVNAYLQEEEALYQQKEAAAPPPVNINPWSLSGRQNMMNLRQLIQMKPFARF